MSLEDLAERLTNAMLDLQGLAEYSASPSERARLDAKASGVALALSYVNDEIKQEKAK